MSDTPLLAASDARIAIDGVVAIDRLSLMTVGDRAVFAGDPGALFAAITGVPRSASGAGRANAIAGEADHDEELSGEAFVVAGALLLAGRSVADGAHVPTMGAAPLDPPLPQDWSAEEYVIWGARLGGASRREARSFAAQAFVRAGLRDLQKKPIRALVLPERRALALAQAVVLQPEVIVAEAPLSGLEGAGAALVLQAIASVTEGRRALLSVARLDPASPEGELARSGSHLVVLAVGEVALEGPPGELFSGATIVSLTVRSNAAKLRDELAARGIELRGGPVRFSASLPAGASTRDLLVAAQAARAAVVELVPVIG